MSYVVFDIETGALPEDELKRLCPPFEPRPFNDGKPFDPLSVKTGNLKDQSKIDAKIREAADKFDLDRARHETQQQKDEQEHFGNFCERAALDASTGRVIAVGFCPTYDGSSFWFIGEEDEARTLAEFWRLFQEFSKQKIKMAGVNIFSFDLPFLIRRSWINNVWVPESVCDLTSRWCNWSPLFVDLRRVWQLGDNQCKSSFEHISTALGVGGKFEGLDGKDFARLWQKNREQAIKYLKQDVSAPTEWLRRFGLVKKGKVVQQWDTI